MLDGLAAAEKGVPSVAIEPGVRFTGLATGADLSAAVMRQVKIALRDGESAFIMAPPGQASVDAVYVLPGGADVEPHAYLLQLTVNRKHDALPREPVALLVDALDRTGVANVELLVVFPEDTAFVASLPRYTVTGDTSELPPIHRASIPHLSM